MKNTSKKGCTILNKNRPHFPGEKNHEKMLCKICKSSSNFLGEKTPPVCCAIFVRTARIFQESLFQIFTRTPTIFQQNIPPRTAILNNRLVGCFRTIIKFLTFIFLLQVRDNRIKFSVSCEVRLPLYLLYIYILYFHVLCYDFTFKLLLEMLLGNTLLAHVR